MGKYVVRSGGGYLKKGIEKILYYLPLTKSLKDYSSYERATDYQGSTEQSFDENKGLFLYNNTLTLDNSFLSDVENNYFSISFDIWYEQNGVTPDGRCILTNSGNYLLEITNNQIQQKSETNFRNFNLFTSPTFGQWHHIDLFFDISERADIFIFVDNNYTDIKSIWLPFEQKDFRFNSLTYGVNGYIKEIIIKTGYSEKFYKNVLTGKDILAISSLYGATPSNALSVTNLGTAYQGVNNNEALQICGLKKDSIEYGVNFYFYYNLNSIYKLYIVSDGEHNCDYFKLYINDIEVQQCKNTEQMQYFQITIPKSNVKKITKMRCIYRKDGSSYYYSDSAYVNALVEYKKVPINYKKSSETNLLPYQNGIIGYFDYNSVDIENNIWENLINNEVDIILNNPAIEDNSLYATSNTINNFLNDNQPYVFYIIVKKTDVENLFCLLDIKRTTADANKDFGIIVSKNNGCEISIQGENNFKLGTHFKDYECIAIARISNIDQQSTNAIGIFQNGKFIGTLNNAIYGDYGKEISFLKQYDVTTSSYINLISNYIYIRALVIGELEQSVNEIIENSKFLMNKYMS